ncbi:MAG: Hpt domain-containing protein, partial [Myxococcales bacterium]|nr:Hpt domain-containing protein [Myxococcales bacterium]
MDLSKYRHLYVTETQEILENLARTLVDLEGAPSDRERVNTAFRLFHSIKGMSGTMGFSPVFDLAHQLEELMDRVRKGLIDVPGRTMDLLLSGVDRLGQWVADVEVGREPMADLASRQIHGRIALLLEGSRPPPAVEAPSEPLRRGDGDLMLEVELAQPSTQAGVRGYLLRKRLEALGTVVDSAPSAEQLRGGRLTGPLRLALRTTHPADVVRAFVEVLAEWRIVTVEAGDVAASSMEELFFTGELDASLAADATPRADPAAIVRPGRSSRTLRVRADWLDELQDSVDTLRALAVRLESQVPATSADTLTELRRVLVEVGREVRAIRRVPLAVITDPLLRVVRDMARQAGKRAVLRVEGADQPLDRTVIEGVDAALSHLVRNAVEHGLEAPDVRRAAGKAGTGLVAIRCRRLRDEVVLDLADDGAGIDPQRLVQRAVDQGLLPEAEARQLARADLVRLLALPGLTTREEVGALAGRGIGMDAIQSAVVALGGTLQVRTRPGEGTLFRLRLPAVRGLVQLVEVVAGGQTMLVAEAQVREVIAAPVIQGEGAERYVEHRGHRWAVARLADHLGLTPAGPDG